MYAFKKIHDIKQLEYKTLAKLYEDVRYDDEKEKDYVATRVLIVRKLSLDQDAKKNVAVVKIRKIGIEGICRELDSLCTVISNHVPYVLAPANVYFAPEYLILEYPVGLNGYTTMDFFQQRSLCHSGIQHDYFIRIVGSMFFSLLETLTQTHGAGIIHRDLKPGNIVYDGKTLHPWLIDFGISARLGSSVKASCYESVTKCYRPFEQQKHSWIYLTTETLEEWSFGVVLLEWLLGYNPFEKMDSYGFQTNEPNKKFKNLREVIHNFKIDVKTRNETMWKELDLLLEERFKTFCPWLKTLREFLKHMLHLNPMERKSCTQLLQMAQTDYSTFWTLSKQDCDNEFLCRVFYGMHPNIPKFEQIEKTISFEDWNMHVLQWGYAFGRNNSKSIQISPCKREKPIEDLSSSRSSITSEDMGFINQAQMLAEQTRWISMYHYAKKFIQLFVKLFQKQYSKPSNIDKQEFWMAILIWMKDDLFDSFHEESFAGACYIACDYFANTDADWFGNMLDSLGVSMEQARDQAQTILCRSKGVIWYCTGVISMSSDLYLVLDWMFAIILLATFYKYQ